LAPLGTDKTYDIHGFTVKNLMSGTPVVDWSQAVNAYPHLRGADIPHPKCGDRIQILLGVKYAEWMTPYKVLRGLPVSGAPVAELTDLGWAFSGRTSKKRPGYSTCQLDNSLIGQALMALGTFDWTAELKDCCSQNAVEIPLAQMVSADTLLDHLLSGVDAVPNFTELDFLSRSRMDILTDFEFSNTTES
jgi:hypothetical protein